MEIVAGWGRGDKRKQDRELYSMCEGDECHAGKGHGKWTRGGWEWEGHFGEGGLGVWREGGTEGGRQGERETEKGTLQPWGPGSPLDSLLSGESPPSASAPPHAHVCSLSLTVSFK